MAANAAEIWKKTLACIQPEIGELAFSTWLARLEAVQMDGHRFVLAAPDEITQTSALRYEPLIRNALEQLTAIRFHPEIILQEDRDRFLRPAAPTGFAAAAEPAPVRETNLNPQFTFENFVVGQSNAFAHSACVSVAENQKKFNPLFLYGGSGLGKTHLLHAIGNYVQRTQPHRKVLYVTCEQFVNEFITTIKEGRYESFRTKYRSCNMLLIDDIQFIESKEQTQIEFFSTFNALYEVGGNIILTCDKPPQSLSTLEERLRSRFSSGLIIDISQPEYETRCAILEKRAQQDRVSLPPEVTEFLANHFTTNVRELEGAYQTVLAYSMLAGGLTLPVAQDALRNLLSPIKKQLTPDMILEMIARYFQLSLEEIKGKQKSKEKAMARQIAMYLLAKHTNITYERIGQILCKHHSTVMHGYSKIQEALQNRDAETTEIVEQLTRRILGQETDSSPS